MLNLCVRFWCDLVWGLEMVMVVVGMLVLSRLLMRLCVMLLLLMKVMCVMFVFVCC